MCHFENQERGCLDVFLSSTGMPFRKGNIKNGSWALIKRTKHCKAVNQKRGFDWRQDRKKEKDVGGYLASERLVEDGD